MNTPPRGVLQHHFPLQDVGADLATLADLNGDGKPEFLFHQTAGQLRSKVYGEQAARLGIDERDQELYCLTAVNMEGEILWQDGTPWEHEEPFTQHGGSSMLLVEDIDADGKLEVVVVRQKDIAILDAATGAVKASTPFPADNFVVMISAQLGDPANGRQIVLKVNDKAYAPWKYGNPTIVYNADLSVYHEPFSVRGAGHNIVAHDINNDGRDELLIGYSLLDHECNECWRLDLGEDFDYEDEHADSILLSDVNGDGKLEVQYAGSDDFFVTDLDGNILWKTAAGHSQLSIEGPWGPNGEKRILMSEKNRGLWGLDADGKILWNRTDINGYAEMPVTWARTDTRTNWALFMPTIRPFESTPYQSDPTWSKDLWPRFLDGDGTVLDIFPWDESYVHPAQTIRAKRSYDAGIKYNFIVRDLDEDGLDEVIVHDRRNVWIFHSEES